MSPSISKNRIQLRPSKNTNSPFSLNALVAAVALITSASVIAENSKNDKVKNSIDEIIVTGVQTKSPLLVETNPKAPRQPLPAHDGADYLKTIPGFSVIRKGGSDGDPLFRGMAGSRLTMSIDGETVLGGCSNRMDPPTAYVFPESYDSIKVVKGPQTVLHGSGNSAGVVIFEHDSMQPEKGFDAHTSLLFGAFGRRDQAVDFIAAGDNFYARGMATLTEQDNFEDGDGVEVHSAYERWNTQLAIGWTPNENTTLELSGSLSDGEAAYADRGVDGSLFDRENVGLKYQITNLGENFEKLDAQVYYNYVDHVMDNYTLRESTGMMSTQMAMNPARKTSGARVTTHWNFGESILWSLGMDYSNNSHTNRSTMNQELMPYESMDRVEDSEFTQTGLFTEVTFKQAYTDGTEQRIVSGLRADKWEGKDSRDNVAVSMMMSMPNPTANEKRSDTLFSGFSRYEKDLNLSIPTTFYIGVGHTQRFPDYWELISKETATSISAFNTDVEKTTQLDTGVIFSTDRLNASLSAFFSSIDDYILIQTGITKAAGMMGTRSATITRNIDARTWGMEADANYAFTDQWRMNWTLASVRGVNETDDTTLAQLPPLEMRFGVHYDNSEWAFGALYRLVDEQTRVDINSGNIVGQDIGETDGFGVFSLNGSWKPKQQIHLSAGVDNILNEIYAEHISRSSAMIAGFEQTTRVNEPGRTAWLKAQYQF